MTYVAFLRGINVGGNKKIPMLELQKMFSKLGFQNVRTLLASGNVVFEASAKPDHLNIEQAIERTFGFHADVLVVSAAQIKKIAKSDPFAKFPASKQIHQYVTFIGTQKKTTLPIPYTSPDGSFTIFNATGTEIFSILDRTKTKTPEAMAILEKTFGKNITTRNWNTVEKLLALIG